MRSRALTWPSGGAKSADSLVTGSITRLADDHNIRFRLWDVVRAQDLGGQSFVVSQGDLRLVAHRIADFVYEEALRVSVACSPRASGM